MISQIVGRLHVSASNIDVVRAVRQAMTKAAQGREHRQARHEFMRAAIEHHQDNRRTFTRWRF
jgi:hypothetical protein